MAARLRWNRWIRLAELSDRSITIKLSAQCLPLSALSLFLINRGIGLQFGLVPGQRGSLPCLSAAFSALWKEHKKGTNLPDRAFWVGNPCGGGRKGILPKNKVWRLAHNGKKHLFKCLVHWIYNSIISHLPLVVFSHPSASFWFYLPRFWDDWDFCLHYNTIRVKELLRCSQHYKITFKKVSCNMSFNQWCIVTKYSNTVLYLSISILCCFYHYIYNGNIVLTYSTSFICQLVTLHITVGLYILNNFKKHTRLSEKCLHKKIM